MKCVRQPVLDRPRPLPPLAGIVDPVGAVRDIGPSAAMGDALGQRVDVALGAIQRLHLAGDPVGGQPLGRPDEMAVDLPDQAGVRLGQDLAEVRDLAHLPEKPDTAPGCRQRLDLGIAGQHLQRQMVVGVALSHQQRRRRPGVERLQQSVDGAEIEGVVPPPQALQRLEPVLLDAGDLFLLERSRLGGGAEAAIGHVASRTAGDLRQLGRHQAPRRPAVELVSWAKATWSTSMLRPMPMASVATRKSTSPAWNIATWAFRTRGLSAPMTTAAPPRWRRMASASS